MRMNQSGRFTMHRKGVAAVGSRRKGVPEMSNDDTREGQTGAVIRAFLQNKSMEQTRDYLSRGRRFAQLALGELNQYWVIAVRSWLARKDPTNELIMDDLASELGLRQVEPPYGAVKHELMQRFAQANKSQQEKKIREIMWAIGEFMRDNERHSIKS